MPGIQINSVDPQVMGCRVSFVKLLTSESRSLFKEQYWKMTVAITRTVL